MNYIDAIEHRYRADNKIKQICRLSWQAAFNFYLNVSSLVSRLHILILFFFEKSMAFGVRGFRL